MTKYPCECGFPRYDCELCHDTLICSEIHGEYGGESIIMWDADKESLSSWYFTTAGFYTQAIMHFEDGNLISTEDVTGNENGITQVKAIVEFLSNGQMHTTSKYLMNGKWIDGHEIYYNEAPGEKVIFK